MEPSEPATQTAKLEIAAGPLRLKMKLAVTPAGLLAIGGLVSGILLSTAVLVWTATSVPRRHPLAGRIPPG
jgi:hypothetical protein